MSSETILLVEDNKMLRHLVRERLEEEGFIVIEAAHGKRFVEVVRRHKVDLILLDLRLPDGNGLDFIGEVRKYTDAPLLIVSGDDKKESRIKGLDGGADDYICKPLDLDELAARIRANIRRYVQDKLNHKMRKSPVQTADRVGFGGWVIDRARMVVCDRETGKDAELTAQEFRVLDALLHNAGRAMTRQNLCALVQDAGFAPSPRVIDIKVTRIRKKIGEDPAHPAFIRTVRGVGYMFVGETDFPE